MKKVTGIGGIFSNAKIQTQLTNGIKNTLGLIQLNTEQALNGCRLIPTQAEPKKGLPSGILLKKQQSILSLQQRTL